MVNKATQCRSAVSLVLHVGPSSMQPNVYQYFPFVDLRFGIEIL